MCYQTLCVFFSTKCFPVDGYVALTTAAATVGGVKHSSAHQRSHPGVPDPAATPRCCSVLGLGLPPLLRFGRRQVDVAAKNHDTGTFCKTAETFCGCRLMTLHSARPIFFLSFFAVFFHDTYEFNLKPLMFLLL